MGALAAAPSRPHGLRRRGDIRLCILAAAGCASLAGSTDISTGNGANAQADLPVSGRIYIEDPEYYASNCNYQAGCRAAEADVAVSLPVVRLQSDNTDSFTYDGLDGARLKVVEWSIVKEDALDGACLTSNLGERIVAGDWASGLGVATTPSDESGDGQKDDLTADVPMQFTQGGRYKMCYSRNGTFDVNDGDVVPVELQVNGVFDNCTGVTCVRDRRYECYLRKEAFNAAAGSYQLTSSCAVDFSGDGAGFVGNAGKGSWTAEWTTSRDTSGMVQSVTTQSCGSDPATFICRAGGACDAGYPNITANVIANLGDSSKGQIHFPVASDKLLEATYYPRTVAACYCPDRGLINQECESISEYVQQIGILHYYLMKVCHYKDTKCETDYTGVVAQYQFRVRVECPTDACSANDNNRIKIVQASDDNDLPSWSSGSGCGTAQHGMLGTTNVLPQRAYDGGLINEQNCDGPTSCLLNGGSRQDYKEFGGDMGFQFVVGKSNHEMRNFHEPKDFDVCYCNEDCDMPTSWFKVGQLRLSPTRLVSAATSKSTAPAQMSLEFMNSDGVVGLSRPYTDAGVLGLNEGGVLKIMQDEPMEVDDTDCALNGYDPTLVDGLSSQVVASLNFRSSLQTQTPADPTKLVFNSNSFVNVIQVKKPGNIAICFCALTVDSVCVDRYNWKLLTHMTIKGPRVDQSWRFSTNVNFRFEYDGYGLTSGDTLRIISSDGDCQDDNGNPNSADFSYTSLKVRCPDPCEDVTLVSGSQPGDLPVMVLSSETYNCDTQNSACSTNYIWNVTVLNETHTYLEFEHPPGLFVGEEITLGANIIVDCSIFVDPTSCLDEADEQVATLRGVYDFADLSTKTSVSPSTYMTAHKIVYVSENVAMIDIGWPSPRPNFAVQPDVTEEELQSGLRGRGGMWTHRSRAITREEIRGTTEKANLRVCWRYGGHGARYVEEIGRLTIVAPASMLGASVSLTSTLYGQKAPVVLAFKTATGVTGVRYADAEGSLRLNLIFPDTSKFNLFYTDESEMPLIYEEGDKDNAKQSSCGKLFLELWSDDSQRGFPLPKGCYFSSYASGNGYTRKLTLLFEGKSGLNKDTNYQIVFNAAVLDQSVEQGGVVMELFTMDDVVNKPYEAIEYGAITLSTAPQPEGTGDTDPRFRVPGGFTIVGGSEDIIQLRASDSIRIEVMGDGTFKRITPNHIIRIYLWPLTQWETAGACQARCFDNDENNFVCGQFTGCNGLSVVPGANKNMLKMVLPQEMSDIYGSSKAKIEISGLTIPAGGFFAGHLAAQVTRDDDTAPHYVVSVGDYIWKEPNDGHPVSKVMSSLGGGNELPYRGDQENVLYARLLLSSTVFARGSNAGRDASFKITLPEGYTCLNEQLTAPPGTNAWAAEDTLAAMTEVPQGRGTPSNGTALHGWSVSGNECIYTPEHPFGVVYAGSSLIVKLTVNNKEQALQRSDPANLWTVQMTGLGMHPTKQQVTKRYPFLSDAGDLFYQTNVAALGKIEDTFCQPTRTAPALPGQPLYLNLWFRPESQVESSGLILIQAPVGYTFGFTCVAEDLEEFYYSFQVDASDVTMRLPGIASCTTAEEGFKQAEVMIENILRPGRLYGFQIRVFEDTNTPAGMDDWQVFTADTDKYLIDGFQGAVSCSFGSGSYWGARVPSAMSATMVVTDMRPYIMTNMCSHVSITINNLPNGPSGPISLYAPEGYEWDLSCSDLPYVFQTASGAGISAPYVPQGVTAAFPAGTPTQSGNVLTWQSATFSNAEVYGLAIPVRVPASTPTASANTFFFEFGTVAAAAVDAPKVQALKNSKVDYSSSVQAKENLLQFEVETVSDIPVNGGLVILAARGFVFESVCDVLPGLDPTVPPPPPLSCTASYDFALEKYRLILQVPADGQPMPAGMYSFAVLGENPTETVLSFPDPETTCGASQCWSFRSIENLNGPLNLATDLDYRTATQGFSIRAQLYDAFIPDITQAQRIATARDDRPLQQNNVVFGFQVIEDIDGTMTLLLRGPYGFFFEEECIESVFVDQSLVFGAGQKFPPDYTVWPDDIAVAGCRGFGADAYIDLQASNGGKFSTGNFYVFRIGFVNPQATPAENFWTIEMRQSTFPGQTSLRFEGIVLWALTDTQVDAISTSRVLFGDPTLQNPVTMSFRPHNVLLPDGYILAEVPVGFRVVALSSMVCQANLEEVPYELLGVRYPGYSWASENLVCVVQENNDERVASISFTDMSYQLTPGLKYELILRVFNPAAISGEPTEWKVSTWDKDGIAQDGTNIQGFTLQNAVTTFTFSNVGQNGGAELPPAFYFKMRFPADLLPGHTVQIIAPPGFVLTDACDGITWYESEVDSAPTATYNPFDSSLLTCTETDLKIAVMGDDLRLANSVLQFYIPLTNPTSTPVSHENFWRCIHFGANMERLSMKALESWEIFPQIADVQFRLEGPLLAADSVSSLSLTFTPVSAAEDILIVVEEPVGFNFNLATVSSDDQEVLVTDDNSIRVRADIKAEQVNQIVLSNVLLGTGGGQTVITLSTFTGGLFQNGEWIVGDRLDNIVGYNKGFRLPGKLKVISERLESQYQQDPFAYPVQSLLSVQMNKLAFAKFDFYVTLVASPGTTLVVSGSPYLPTTDGFVVKRKQNSVASALSNEGPQVISTRDVIASGGTLTATLEAALIPNILYTIDLSVHTPTPAEAKEVEATTVGSIYWTIGTEDGGELPVNTNDAESRPFKIVEELNFNVTSTFAPPMAKVVISLELNVGLYYPTELTLIAPPGFSFPEDCLIYGGSEILACAPGSQLAGRATAVLSTSEAGVTYSPPDVRLWVYTPEATPAAKEWFIEGTYVWNGAQVAWGQAPGLDVMQMSGTSLSYPAIPDVEARMVWTFKTQVVVQTGGYLEVVMPPKFNPNCEIVERISFPEDTSCYANEDGTFLVIHINTTIVPDDYIFGFKVMPPVLTPDINEFSITLKDRDGHVQDAATGVDGVRIMDKLQAKESQFLYTNTRAGWTSEITMGFQVMETFPDNFVAGDQQVGQILLSFPEGFVHEVSSENDLTLLSTNMPLQDNDWLDYYHKDRLLIKLDLNRTFWTTLAQGAYEFKFPVKVPSQLPVYNIWHVTLCTLTTFPGECTSPSDPGALVTFALPGFALGEGSQQAAGGAAPSATARWATLAFVLFVPFLFALRTDGL